MKRRIVIDSKNCGSGECRVVLQESQPFTRLEYNEFYWIPVASNYLVNPTCSDLLSIMPFFSYGAGFKLRSEE